MKLNQDQNHITQRAIGEKIFLTGLTGCGKSSTGMWYIKTLLENNVPGNKILLLVPQKSLGSSYKDFFDGLTGTSGFFPSVETISGISHKVLRLFWPIIAPKYGFTQPKTPPTFLNIESAQYYLTKVCEPFFENNYFSSIKAEKPRILSQILDNLNKSAIVGFPHQEISLRLKSAWNKESSHLVAFDEAQECANAFRKFCLQFNLFDFSLSYEIFKHFFFESYLIQQFLFSTYYYLVYDNCEEDTPVAHDLILEWLPHFKGGLVIFDEDAGYRSFLGADPTSAIRLEKQCDSTITFQDPIDAKNSSNELISLYKKAIHHQKIPQFSTTTMDKLSFEHYKFYPDMIDGTVNKIEELIQSGVEPGRIAILAPFVSNSLRFQIQQYFEQKNLKLISHRPSRSLNEEPIAHGLLTWVKLAYPEWGLVPSIYQFRTAINQTIENMDPVRADLFARLVLAKNGDFLLRPLEDIRPEMMDRLTMQAIIKYQQIFSWIKDYQKFKSEVDVFLASFFGEILSQKGFGFHQNYEGAEVTGKLIESMQNFRKNTLSHFQQSGENWAKEFIQMLENGLISALYLQTWETPPLDSVYLAPAHTFLMQNRSVDYQFWLDIGNLGWWQRLMQPLTQPFVLSRNWIPGTKWTDVHEYENNQTNLEKLLSGLLRRCSTKAILLTSGYSESGYEQVGPLLKATQSILRSHQHNIENAHV